MVGWHVPEACPAGWPTLPAPGRLNDIILDLIRLDHIKLDRIRLDHIRLDHIRQDHIRLDHIRLDDIRLDHIKIDRIRLDHVKGKPRPASWPTIPSIPSGSSS